MRTPIRVMHILHTLGTAGLQKGVVNLANHLRSKGIETSICCLETGGEFEKRLNQETRVFFMKKQPGIDYTMPLRLARLFKIEKTMIVHTHNLGTYMYGAVGAKLAGSPKLVHGEHGFQFCGYSERELILRRYLSYLTDVIHTVSADLKNMLIDKNRISPGKIITILNGVELEKFRNAHNPQLKMKIGIQPEELVIGTVGRLTPVKNFELLIRVIPELKRRGVRPKMLIVGDGPLRPELESSARQYNVEGQLLFLGDRSDVPDLLNVMDIFVLPSIREGLSNSILEAMAVAIPVIASDVGGNPELVVNNETGFLFPSQDADMLVQKILELAEAPDKRCRMGVAGRRRVEEFFTMDKMLQSYELIYRNVLLGKKFNWPALMRDRG